MGIDRLSVASKRGWDVVAHLELVVVCDVEIVDGLHKEFDALALL